MKLPSAWHPLVTSIALFGICVGAHAAPPAAATAKPAHDGAHDFDFEFGNWRVHHRMESVCAPDWRIPGQFQHACQYLQVFSRANLR